MNRKRRWPIAIALICVLSLVAFAAYELLLPDPAALTLQENMQVIRDAMEGNGTQETFEQTLDNMDDDMLFSVVAEAAYLLDTEYPDVGTLEALGAFNRPFLERIAPNVEPEMLYDVLVGDYPSGFKIYVLQGVCHTNGEVYGSALQFDPAYAAVLQNALWLPEVRVDENLTGQIIRTIPWNEDDNPTDVLYDLYHTSAEQSRTYLYALMEIEQLDSTMAMEAYFAALDKFAEMQDNELTSTPYSLYGLSRDNPELAEEIASRLHNFADRYLASEQNLSDDFINSLMSNLGKIYGRAHIKGMVRYIMEHQNQIPRARWTISIAGEFLYPEVNDMLLSTDEQEVRWALTWVKGNPYGYYIPNLQAIRTESEELAKEVAEMLEFCKTENFSLHHPELATEGGST